MRTEVRTLRRLGVAVRGCSLLIARRGVAVAYVVANHSDKIINKYQNMSLRDCQPCTISEGVAGSAGIQIEYELAVNENSYTRILYISLINCVSQVPYHILITDQVSDIKVSCFLLTFLSLRNVNPSDRQRSAKQAQMPLSHTRLSITLYMIVVVSPKRG